MLRLGFIIGFHNIYNLFMAGFRFYNLFEAGRGAAARGVSAKPTGCGFDPHSRR